MPVPTFPLINYTFFIRDLKIPNIDPSKSPSNAPEKSALDSSILKYESEALELILGYQLSELFRTEDSARMGYILNGAEFTDANGDLQKWIGLVYDTTKISILANYVYFCIQEDNAKQTTGTGTVVNKAEAGRMESPAEKMMKAWKFFSENVETLIYFLWTKTADDGTRLYPEFSRFQYEKTSRATRNINIFGL